MTFRNVGNHFTVDTA